MPVGWSYYEHAASSAANRHGVPSDMFIRLLRAENPLGDPSAVNPRSGAAGLGQFMPGTAALMGIDPLHPGDSLNAAAMYLSRLRSEFGDWKHAVMSYNWGSGNVRKWLDSGRELRVPEETQAYLRRIAP